MNNRQGEPSDSDTGPTFVKGVGEGKKIGKEELQTTVQFWESLDQAVESL